MISIDECEQAERLADVMIECMGFVRTGNSGGPNADVVHEHGCRLAGRAVAAEQHFHGSDGTAWQ